MLLNTTVPLSVSFDTPGDFVIFIFHILFATSAVLVAGSVAIGISCTRFLRRQNRFIFMLNTSVSDTLTGFSVYYLGLFDVQEGYPSRNGTYYILPWFLGVNVLTFLFAQFDRYFAVCHPFFYHRYIVRCGHRDLRVLLDLHVHDPHSAEHGAHLKGGPNRRVWRDDFADYSLCQSSDDH